MFSLRVGERALSFPDHLLMNPQKKSERKTSVSRRQRRGEGILAASRRRPCKLGGLEAAGGAGVVLTVFLEMGSSNELWEKGP